MAYSVFIPARQKVFIYVDSLKGDNASMLTHTCQYVNPYIPTQPLRKIKVTICNHQADSQLYVWPDV